MSSFRYTHTRERERDRNTSSPPPSLPRRTSFKRQRLFSSDDEDAGYDDYPYAGNHRPSRALVKRDQPTQLERWGIWTDARKQERCDSAAEDDGDRREPLRPRARTRKVSFAARVERDADEGEDEERAFRVQVATLARSRPRPASPPPSRRRQTESDDERRAVRGWSGELFRTRERCVSEDYEAHERARSRSRECWHREMGWCDDEVDQRETEVEAERWVTWRRLKRTRTEERRPLAGWRRM
ncbi:uncharacterized protein EKO05_0004104 [Ascochyta rabiei]|uniref:uncharacterized protein n=1 Tax=Didymella rabiei TaxID=5454 RepID=UPI0019020925|nr:uncharacterized protein EKO05_0004104 [Ascochyta rabiei]UPX13602.1 hypothetical protein EKO05_0004104 [Ascochyta rabiei]